MLELKIPPLKGFDEREMRFIEFPARTLRFEHSLISMSKWESKWKKPFISEKPRTVEESYDYIRCMCITKDVPDVYLTMLDSASQQAIADYIEDPMTATWFSEDKEGGRGKKETFTSEVIYYYMISCGIPVEFEKWHLKRLLTLLRVFAEKNKKPKKMGQKDVLSRNKTLNEARRKKYNTRG